MYRINLEATRTTTGKLLLAIEHELAIMAREPVNTPDYFRHGEVIEALARSLDAAVKAEQWMKERNT